MKIDLLMRATLLLAATVAVAVAVLPGAAGL
jgi:hypothetical protein